MKTKLPLALVYGWDRLGTHEIVSDVYYWEGLNEKVVVQSVNDLSQFREDFIKYDPDVIISIGPEFVSNLDSLNKRIVHVQEMIPDNILANIIVCQTTFKNSSFLPSSARSIGMSAAKTSRTTAAPD